MGFLGHALLEDHHAAHRCRALGVGNVVTLDAVGRRRQAQGGLQLGQGLLLAVGIGLPLRLERRQGFGGILGGHLHQLALLSLARHKDLHLFPAAARVQPFANDAGLLDIGGQEQLRRHAGRFIIELLQEGRQHRGIWRFMRPFHHKILPPDQLAAANEKDLHAGLPIRTRHGDDIRVDIIGRKNHPLAGNDLLDRA